MNTKIIPVITLTQADLECEYAEPEIADDGHTLVNWFWFGESARMSARVAALEVGQRVQLAGKQHRKGETWIVKSILREGDYKPEKGESAAERKRTAMKAELDLAFEGDCPKCYDRDSVKFWRERKVKELADAAAATQQVKS